VVTQAPKRSAILVALLFALSCIGLIIFVWTQFGGSIPFAAQGYRIKALFPETGLLVPGADVRISGVNIGRVSQVQAKGVNSLVTMDLTQRYAPIPADTRAILRQKTLLGEAYVMLSTGSRTAPKLPDGGTLPSANVAPSQPLDKVLNSFTPTVQHNLQTFLIGMGGALAGRGQDLNDAFGNFDPAISELSAVVGVLNQQQSGVRSLIADGGTVLNTLAARRTELQSLATTGNEVLAATAARAGALTATVDAMAPFLGQLRTTLTKLNTTLGIARPSLEDLRPVTPLLTPALRGLNDLSTPVLGLLRSAPALLRASQVALPAMRRFTLAFRPAVDRLLPAAQQIAPVINLVAEFKLELLAGMTNLAADLEGLAPANTPSGTAHYLRALITLGTDSAYGQSTRAPGTRNNAYFAPGEQNDIASGGKTSSSCAHTGNTAQFPVAGGNVPCRVQGAHTWGYGISPAYFPRAKKASP